MVPDNGLELYNKARLMDGLLLYAKGGENMAVKAPIAPTPPVPPSVPGVTLQDGGTAQETNIPQDRQQTGDEQAEA